MIDRKLLTLTFVLTFVGILAVANASAPTAINYFSDGLYFAKQQIVWAAVGFVALIVASKLHYTFWKRTGVVLFFLSIALLVAVLLPGIGSKILGARRWINLGPASVQPSEIVKFTLIVYLASVADAKKKLLAYMAPIILVTGLVMLQPDLGTTIVIAIIAFVQLFVAQIPLLPFLGMGIAGLIATTLLILFSSYRRERLTAFLDGLAHPLESSYHVRQILIALGSGGLFGVGLGQGRQKNLFLPESATDSVFAVIGEEVGFIGATIVIIVLGYFIYRCIRIAQYAPDRFSMILASGIVAWISGQTIINIASMVALVPLTGIPLPFFSYGGSSLTMILLGVGILLNISKYGKK